MELATKPPLKPLSCNINSRALFIPLRSFIDYGRDLPGLVYRQDSKGPEFPKVDRKDPGATFKSASSAGFIENPIFLRHGTYNDADVDNGIRTVFPRGRALLGEVQELMGELSESMQRELGIDVLRTGMISAEAEIA
jgi:hypothetical protein